MTQALYYVVGDPVAHSRSPAMHNAAFHAAGIDALYAPLRVPAGGFDAMVDALPDATRGFNVTYPQKEAAWAWCRARGSVSPAADALRAVNTVILDPGAPPRGENTDASGFPDAFADAFPGTPAPRNCLVLGAGGAARAIGWALGHAGTAVTFAVRSPARAKSLRQLVPDCALLPFGDAPAAAATFDAIVNATPVGMGDDPRTPLPGAAFAPGQRVMDLVYSPPVTPLLRDAATQGAATANGLPLLLHQAMHAFTLWTRLPAPAAPMRAALSAHAP